MKRIAFFMTLVMLLAVHTGCRTASTSCRHSTCCPNQRGDAVQLLEPEMEMPDTARRSIGDSQGAEVGGDYRYDPVLPPNPEVDQEV